MYPTLHIIYTQDGWIDILILWAFKWFNWAYMVFLHGDMTGNYDVGISPEVLPP